MIRISASALVSCVVATLLVGTVHSPTASADTNCPPPSLSFGDGDGSSGDPYLVQSPGDLQLLKTDGTYRSQYFRQTGNIDMQVTAGTDCIWDAGINGTFSGNYDGGGYEITGLNISSGQKELGLFQSVTGSISNVGFTGNVTSSSTNNSSPHYIGGLVGWLYGGSVTDSYTTGSVTSLYTENNNSGTGGLVGVARTDSSGSYANISGSYATGTVSAKYIAGGLVGRSLGTSSSSVQITESYATGNVSSSVREAGGFAGVLIYTAVQRSFATGDVSFTGFFTSGGTHYHFAGFAGDAQGSTVTDSYATGGIDGGSLQVGGFVGDYASSGTNQLTRTFSTTTSGFRPRSGATESGGYVGYSWPAGRDTATTSFWNYETSGYTSSSSGTGAGPSTGVNGRSTSELTDLTTFTDGNVGVDWNTGGASTIAEGYDPGYTWGICPAVNSGYPFLTAFYTSDPCTNPPTPSAGDYSRPTATFHFRLDNGQECAPISPQLVYTNTRYVLPGANAPCRTPGSELVGWAVPHQDWDFAPGATVFVVESQVFTAVLRQPTISVKWDANVGVPDTCLVDPAQEESDAMESPRTEVIYLDRPEMSDYPAGARPSLIGYLAPYAAPCTPPGLALTGWQLDSRIGEILISPGEPIHDAIVQASPNGGINDFTFRAQWGFPRPPREISRAGFFAGTSDQLTDGGRQRLRELQQAIPAGASNVVIEILGVSESLATPTENQQLALKRSLIAKRTLEASGLLGTYLSTTDPNVMAPNTSGSGKPLTTVRIRYLAPPYPG